MIRILAALGLSCWVVSVGPSAATIVDQLERLETKARPVVILSETIGDPRLARQIAALDAAKAALNERDVTVLRAVGSETSLRRTLDAPATGFAVVLVGKDGGVKTIWRDVVEPAAIVRLIDAMPMRRDEMARRAPR